jgi:hypothetical protein
MLGDDLPRSQLAFRADSLRGMQLPASLVPCQLSFAGSVGPGRVPQKRRYWRKSRPPWIRQAIAVAHSRGADGLTAGGGRGCRAYRARSFSGDIGRSHLAGSW